MSHWTSLISLMQYFIFSPHNLYEFLKSCVAKLATAHSTALIQSYYTVATVDDLVYKDSTKLLFLFFLLSISPLSFPLFCSYTYRVKYV